VVSVILINETFVHVAKGPLLILKTFAWKLCLLPHFTLVVDIVDFSLVLLTLDLP
jgi:hypothetical protein